FEGAMARVARLENVALPAGAEIDAEVDLCQGEDGFQLAARLFVTLPGLESGLAQRIVDGASQTCPYSKAVKGNINVSVLLN
ncbi:peroxiredoxin, partial [Thioclava sp. BHET1]